MRILWGHSGRLLGDLCGLTPRRRRQPSGWQRHSRRACRAEPVLLTKGEAATEERCWHTMAVGALVPPDAACVATRDATVYTNAPKRRRGAVFANLCTLLCPHVCPQRRNSVHKCPRTAPRGYFSQSVYTPASHTRPLARPGAATGPTASTAPWPP